MPPKRKRGTATSLGTPKKRPKKPEWYPKGIIDERRTQTGALQYLIDWGSDSSTGKDYVPTWEPPGNVGDGLIDEWKAKKREKKRGDRKGAVGERTSSPAPSPSADSSFVQSKGKKPLRDSTPPPSTPATEEPEIAETQQTQASLVDGLFVTGNTPDRAQAYVAVPEPTPSYWRGEYSTFNSSQIDGQSSQQSPSWRFTQSQTGQNNTNTSSGAELRSSGSHYQPTQGQGDTSNESGLSASQHLDSSRSQDPSTQVVIDLTESSGSGVRSQIQSSASYRSPQVEEVEDEETPGFSASSQFQYHLRGIHELRRSPEPESQNNSQSNGAGDHQSSGSFRSRPTQPGRTAAPSESQSHRHTATQQLNANVINTVDTTLNQPNSSQPQNRPHQEPQSSGPIIPDSQSGLDAALRTGQQNIPASSATFGQDSSHPFNSPAPTHTTQTSTLVRDASSAVEDLGLDQGARQADQASLDAEPKLSTHPETSGRLSVEVVEPATTSRPSLTLQTNVESDTDVETSTQATRPNTPESSDQLPTSFQRPVQFSSQPNTEASAPRGIVHTPTHSRVGNLSQSGISPTIRSRLEDARAQSLPADTYASTLLPGPPSRTFSPGGSAPSRIEPDSSSMESSGTPEGGWKGNAMARMKALRASQKAEMHNKRARESSEAVASPVATNPAIAQSLREQTPGSPSVVPAQEMIPEPTQEEMNTSERYETLIPQLDDKEGSALQRTTSATTHDVQDYEAGVQLLPVQLLGHQRDQYLQSVLQHRNDIHNFLTNTGVVPDGFVQDFIKQMRRVTIHPDLVNTGTYTQAADRPSQQWEWDIATSSKFRLIDLVLKPMYENRRRLHVAMIAPDAMILEKVRTYLEGSGMPFRRPGEAFETEKFQITLFDEADDVAESDSHSVDLVIGLEQTLTQEKVQKLRLVRLLGRSPVVALVVPSSVEHIELSLSSSLPDDVYRRSLVRGIWSYRNSAGKMADGQFNLEDTAISMRQYFVDQNGGWSIPSLQLLQDLETQTDTDVSESLQGSAQGTKRALEDGEDESTPKRAKPTVEPLQKTRVSETNLDSSGTHSGMLKQVVALQQKLDELVEQMGQLQFRFEEQAQKLAERTGERDEAVAKEQETTGRFIDNLNAQTKVKAEMTALKQQLEQAHTALTSQAIPERAEIEAIRLELAAALQAKERSDKRLEKMEGERDYMKQMYNEASTEATKIADENRTLESQLQDAERRADRTKIELKQMFLNEQSQLIEQENSQLKAQLKEREKRVLHCEDELARLSAGSRGRIVTRGGSNPPRVGSPLKQQTGRSSRGVSPSARHPLRNG